MPDGMSGIEQFPQSLLLRVVSNDLTLNIDRMANQALPVQRRETH